ncbi:phage major capsid protein [Variovorax ginsengisoli]|uniref:Phage major capsid protein n=1 Tax=Variovorax ginsengisoli TaxID=363844 RepID=A0ABT8SHN5_9BURK|nr:phage major capsid protein [Variovorax ginsengisoli]MDN8617866.1 phage major capsid protein [Variovorax ginsengisoli]MDO1537036.1 phage major capsid protein [Variovorax ginsengisoli]
MSAKLRALQAKKADLVAGARKFNDETDAKAQAENRGWTDDETKQYAALVDGITATSSAIDRENALIAQEAGLGAAAHAAGGAGGQAAPPVAAAGSHVVLPAGARIGTEHNADADPRRGFRSLGDFAQSVRGAAMASRTGQSMDARLAPLMGPGGPVAAAPGAGTYANEGSGADGGFLIPVGFSTTVWNLSLEEDALLPMTDNLPVEGNGMSLPKDETTPWGSNGVRAYWQNEAGAATATKPVFGRTELKLKKLMALVPVSDELMADASALGAYLVPNMARSIRWKTDEAILFGAGNGTPLGAFFAQSPAFVTVSKESAQATLTLKPENIAKMVSRLLPGSYGKAVWLMNNDALPYLWTLNTNGNQLYLPYGGGQGTFQGSPYGGLMGRPVMVTQHAKSFTSLGDLMLVDLSQYQTITKSSGIETATSMHLYFDADAVAFRSTFRVDGQPKMAAPVNPANGSNTLSPFVQLEAR